jgi:putative endonuclease
VLHNLYFEEVSLREEGALNWMVYMLECADKSLYTGITNHLERRMAAHEAGKGAKYTQGRGPFRLVYSEICQGRAEASRRETAIKSLDRRKKLRLFS